MSILDDKEIKDAIFTETEELINNIEKEITSYEKDYNNSEHIKRLFRFAHTIKGNAGMLGETGEPLVMISHKFEDLLGLIRDGKISFNKEFIPFFYEIHNIINAIFRKLKSNEKVDIDINNVIKNIDEIIKKGEFKGLDFSKRDLVVEVSKEFKEEENIRVDLKKIDSLVNLLGELYLTVKMYTYQFYELKENSNIANLDKMESNILKTNYLLDELREELLNVRMVKLSLLFDRFPAVVKQLATSLNKRIELKIESKDELIDKRVLDEVAEPILHIIRNCVDHGIEPVEERIKRGKKETGTIFIKTYYQGGSIVIEIGDDGAGISIEKIKERLKKMNIYSETEIKFMTEKELINAIFLPGFSTKEMTTEISGRGIGMDIVADKIKKLKGEIEVYTKEFEGTTFKIILPLTLSIVEVFSVMINSSEFLFFKDDVKFLLKITDDQIQKVGEREVVDYENEVIPIYDLRFFFTKNKVKLDEKRIFKNIVVVQKLDELYGFIVDKFSGLKRIVLKEFGYMKSLNIFDGATISERGEIALVINTSNLIQRVKRDLKLKV